MKNVITKLTLLILMLSAGASTVFAVQVIRPVRQALRPKAGDVPQNKRPAVALADAIDTLYLKRIQPEVQLTDDQYNKVGPALMIWLREKRDAANRRTRILNQIRQLTNQDSGEADEERLGVLIRELDKTESDMFESQQKFLRTVDTVLTPRQRARVRFFQNQMERRLQDMLNNNAGRPNQQQPPANTPPGKIPN